MAGARERAGEPRAEVAPGGRPWSFARRVGVLVAVCAGFWLLDRSNWGQTSIVLDVPDELEAGAIERAVPNDRNWVWWWFHRTEIETALTQLPWVKGARVDGCGEPLAPWCFKVSVEARLPRYLAEIGGRWWLVGEDGGYLSEVSPESPRFREISKHFGVKVVRGLVYPSASGNFSRAAFGALTQALKTIESSTARKVEGIDVSWGSALQVKFRDEPATVTYTPRLDDTERLELESRRLNEVFNELGARRAEVERIDLAFRQVAVVNFRRAIEEPRSKQSRETKVLPVAASEKGRGHGAKPARRTG